MRTIFLVALFALVAFAPVKADDVDKDGSSESCTDVPSANVEAAVFIEKVDEKTSDTLSQVFAVALGLDDIGCITVRAEKEGFFFVLINSLNADKTVNHFNNLFFDNLFSPFDGFFVVLSIPAAQVDDSTVDKETVANVDKETTTTAAPDTPPPVLDVMEAIVSDLKSFGEISDDTQDMVDSVCYASVEQCLTLLEFLAGYLRDLMYSKDKSVSDASVSGGVSVGTVVGISIGCVAGTLLIALIALKAKTGSALPRSGRVSLTPSSSSSAALLGHRIDVRSAWSEAEI